MGYSKDLLITKLEEEKSMISFLFRKRHQYKKNSVWHNKMNITIRRVRDLKQSILKL